MDVKSTTHPVKPDKSKGPPSSASALSRIAPVEDKELSEFNSVNTVSGKGEEREEQSRDDTIYALGMKE